MTVPTDTSSDETFLRATQVLKTQGIRPALQVLSSSPSKDLFIRLLECRCLEELGDLANAEEQYLELLETFAGIGSACPLGLAHYLGFIARTRSVSEALTFFDDLYVAESEHVTSDLYAVVALGIAWVAPGVPQEERLETASGVFRKGLSRLRGSVRTDLVVTFADFLAFVANEFKQAQLELSDAAATATKQMWAKWEEVLLEFNADLETIRGMHRMRKQAHENSAQGADGAKKELLVEDPSGILTISDHPEAAVDSWLLSHAVTGEKVIRSMIEKMRIDGIWPTPCSVLEPVLGIPDQAGLVKDDEPEDLRDGGVDELNHVYRPDVTKMLRYVPQEEVERKAEVPKNLKNLIALLPSRVLRQANVQYIADQCIRLLLTINLPSRVITEEAYANVDKRTRASYELKHVKRAPVVAASLLAKEKKSDETAKVKKEEIFDPVEYYSKKS